MGENDIFDREQMEQGETVFRVSEYATPAAALLRKSHAALHKPPKTWGSTILRQTGKNTGTCILCGQYR